MSDNLPGNWIDISVPLRNGMVHWPSDPSFNIRRVKDIDRGDTANVSEISMGAHSGTHMDAPLHFIAGREGIDTAPLDTIIGRARVIEIEDRESVKAEELSRHNILRGERILFKTINSPRAWQTDEFDTDFVYVSDDAADFLVERGVSLTGIDYLSVGSASGGAYVHKTLLDGGIWLIEGLDLTGVKAGDYELVCLPLKLAGAEGAPARAVIRPLSSGEKKENPDA